MDDKYKLILRNALFIIKRPHLYNRELIDELQKGLIAVCNVLDKLQMSKRESEFVLQELARIPTIFAIGEKLEFGVKVTRQLAELEMDISIHLELKNAIEDVLTRQYEIERTSIQESSGDEELISMWNEGFTAEDIGAAVKLAPGTVRNRITRLRKERGIEKVNFH